MRDQWMRNGLFVVLAGLLFTAGCSDAATRVAHDIEAGIGRLGSEEGARAEISHAPRSWPEGCSGAYQLRIEKGSAIDEGQGNFRIREDAGGLSVHCPGDGGKPTGWGTTYHLRFVDVQATVEITKNAGETALIDIRRESGRAVLVGLR